MSPPDDREPAARWDPRQYERFKAERAQPFHDLLARIPDGDVRQVADLGCGTGELTRVLAARWPQATVWAVDSSREMLESGRGAAAAPRLHFVEADLRRWQPPAPLDRIVSNATLHWVPDHAALLEQLASWLAPGGVLAVQVPNNGGEPAYRVLSELLAAPRWTARLPARPAAAGVEAPAWYVARLHVLSLAADVWETIYYHQLPGPEAIVEWLKGTALRPVLSALSAEDAAAFLAALNARIAPAYPPAAHGVVFPFRRLFFVAARR